MRTGPDMLDRHVLPDGTPITVRHIRPEDGPELRRGFAALSRGSRFLRFGAAMTALSDDMIAYLTRVDGQDHVAFVAMHESPDLKTERGVGVARFIRAVDEPALAEAAITVVDDMHHRGVGRVLLTTLAEAARERGVLRFRAEVLASNALLRSILREVNAVVVHEEAGAITFEIPT